MREKVSVLRENLRDRLRHVSATQTPIYVSRRGRVRQVILPVDDHGRVLIPPGVETARTVQAGEQP